MRTLALFTMLAVGTLEPGSAHAGARTTHEVVIGPNFAHGALGSARNSDDKVQYIGCYVTATTSIGPRITCSARNAAGQMVTCTGGGDHLLSVVQTLNGDSYLHFGWITDGANFCTSISVDNASRYEPKE